MNGDLSVYVHVPFCSRRCAYCDFVSTVSSSSEEHLGYFKALWREIELRRFQLTGRDVMSLYFGGGTPSHVPPSLLLKTVELLGEYAHFRGGFEFTVEVNPEDVTEEMAKAYASMGVNRISVGLQSAENEVLKVIGRPHTVEDFLRAWDILEDHFRDLNVDFIVGLPLETGKTIARDMEILGELRPSHVSVYVLEESELPDKMKQLLPDDEETMAHFEEIQDALSKMGYRRYELSNWYLEKPSLHNLRYWENRDYLGLGVSAGGHLGYFRYVNTSNLVEYTTEVERGTLPYAYAKENTEEEELRETLFMCLRLIEGCDLLELKRRFDPSAVERYIERLTSHPDYFEYDGKRLRLTSFGVSHSASALEVLV